MAFSRRLPLYLACWIAFAAEQAAGQADALHAAPASALERTTFERILLAAKANRGQLERALNHFSPTSQPLEHAAMQWLVLHLERHGHARMAWLDASGEAVEIPRSAFLSPEDFEREWAALQAEHGELRPGVIRLDGDLLSLTADELAQNVDFAVRAWRERPWTRDLKLEQFLEGVLPHRVGDEALDDWRKVLFETFARLEDRLAHPRDPYEAAEWIRRSVRSWVEVAPQYAWHLTDQSLTEMLLSKKGRGEDLAHLELMALRANAIPSALDYTPAWAARSGNFAWTRLLLEGAAGRGVPEVLGTDTLRDAPTGRLAKVYRRTFASQPDSWAARVQGTEPLPAWLADAHLRDVTAEYVPVASITVPLRASSRRSVLAYACVFDGQSWTPIAAGRVSDEGAFVRFTDLGREVAYLPAWFDESGVHPAGPPFLLGANGEPRVLNGIGFETPGQWVRSDSFAPAQPAERGVAAEAARPLAAPEGYRLLLWQDDTWVEHQRAATREGQSWWELPPRRLALVQAIDSWQVDARPWTEQFAQLIWW
jgi:hypothetical protein